MLRPDFSIQNMNHARRIRPPLAFLRVDHSIAPVGEMCRCRRCRRCRGTDFENLIPSKSRDVEFDDIGEASTHRHIPSDIGADVTGPMLSMSRRCCRCRRCRRCREFTWRHRRHRRLDIGLDVTGYADVVDVTTPTHRHRRQRRPRRDTGILCPCPPVHDPETEVQLKQPDRAFTGSQEPVPDA